MHLLLQLGCFAVLVACACSSAKIDSSSNTKLIAKSVVVSQAHACALLNGGSLQCWGYNDAGELGDGTTSNSSVPVPVSNISSAVAVSVGSVFDDDTCALLSGGTIQCWGANNFGQLGDGTTTSSSLPVTVPGVTNAVAVATADCQTCALLSGGTIQCWGDNSAGELGNGTTTSSFVPVPVSGIANSVAIVANSSNRSTCAILSGGTVQCWGGNFDGVLGNGTTTDSSVLVPVSGITNATALATNDYDTCALLSDGTVQCWGQNKWGLLGNGTTANSSVPVAVSGISNAIAVAAGCAVLNGGSVQCWGEQLGNGTTNSSSVPVPVSGITDAIAVGVATTDDSACALLSGGSVQCWGANWYGELGNGTTTDSSVPVTVSGF